MGQTSTSETKFARLSNKETYAYREYSSTSSKILLLLHGNFTTSAFFESFVSDFAQEYRIIVPDMRGYGRSTYVTPLNSLDDLCDDIKYFMESLEISCFNLLGWSAGGLVAQLFAIKYPDMVDKLILVGSVGPRGPMMKDDTGKVMNKKEEFSKCERIAQLVKIIKKKDKKAIRTFLVDAGFQNQDLPPESRIEKYTEEILLQRNVIDMFHALNHFNISNENNGISNGSGKIKEIRGPCLIIHGSEDLNVGFLNSWEVKKYLLKKADIQIIKGAQHFIFEPKTSKKVTELVKAFLQ